MDENVFYGNAARACLGITTYLIIATTFGIGSAYESWEPSYEQAIAWGIVSIACSNLVKTES